LFYFQYKTREHGQCKHMPDCSVAGNETDENKHEKPNEVSDIFIEFSVTCDL